MTKRDRDLLLKLSADAVAEFPPKFQCVRCKAYFLATHSGCINCGTSKTQDQLPVETYCNKAVHYVCSGMGYGAFMERTANEIIDTMASSKEWRNLDAPDAQRAADEGVLVVAGWRNTQGGHGHVCMVIPGNLAYSRKWQAYCPAVANVGRENFIGKGANWAFDKEPFYWRCLL